MGQGVACVEGVGSCLGRKHEVGDDRRAKRPVGNKGYNRPVILKQGEVLVCEQQFKDYGDTKGAHVACL